MEGHHHPTGEIILRVNVHCEGCGNEVLKCLRGYEGVESVHIDEKNQKVIVKGEKADPFKVAKRLRKKTGKHVELLHPLHVRGEKKEEAKPPKVIEVVLKIYIHCEGCAKEVKSCILDMEGVQTVDVEMGKNLVIVKGSMDTNKLVEFIRKRGGRYAEIVKQTENQTQKLGERGGEFCYCCASQQVYAPQMFSDENPNACYLM